MSKSSSKPTADVTAADGSTRRARMARARTTHDCDAAAPAGCGDTAVRWWTPTATSQFAVRWTRSASGDGFVVAVIVATEVRSQPTHDDVAGELLLSLELTAAMSHVRFALMRKPGAPPLLSGCLQYRQDAQGQTALWLVEQQRPGLSRVEWCISEAGNG
jgi:hypothetical protein